jgi:uncharacterized membrane protein YsdA (DUF1294 family)
LDSLRSWLNPQLLLSGVRLLGFRPSAAWPLRCSLAEPQMNKHTTTMLVKYLLFINLLTICLFVYDKNRAKKGAYRVRERDLIAVSFLGGWISALWIMKRIKHKTRKPSFQFKLYSAILLNIWIVWKWIFW